MSFPLEMFPVTNADLLKLDAREALRHEMSFMKNVLLYALNNAAALAPQIGATGGPRAAAFATYISKMLDIIATHIRVDAHFFSTPLAAGHTLASVFGPGCTPDFSGALAVLADIRAELARGQFAGTALVHRLGAVGVELRARWAHQLAAVDPRELSAHQTDAEARQATRDVVMFFAAQCDPAFLLPFILSHHDRTAAPFWPPTTPEGWAALPHLMAVHAPLWDFVPFDAKTGAKKA